MNGAAFEITAQSKQIMSLFSGHVRSGIFMVRSYIFLSSTKFIDWFMHANLLTNFISYPKATIKYGAKVIYISIPYEVAR